MVTRRDWAKMVACWVASTRGVKKTNFTLGLEKQNRITSYNVCYTKLLRLFQPSKCHWC